MQNADCRLGTNSGFWLFSIRDVITCYLNYQVSHKGFFCGHLSLTIALLWNIRGPFLHMICFVLTKWPGHNCRLHCHSVKNCWLAGKASIKEQRLLRTQHFILSWKAHWPADPGFCSMEWLLALTRRVFLALTRRYFKLTPKSSRALVELSSVEECNIKGILFPLIIFRFLYWRCFPFKTLFWSWCVKCDNFKYGVCLMFFKPGSQ